jgi:hypothetical protein
MKIYVATMEVLMKKEIHDEIQFCVFQPPPPPLMPMFFFGKVFLISLHVWPNSRFKGCVFLTLWITMIFLILKKT